MSARRLRALVSHLPPNSALQRARDPHWRWTNQEELLASLIEVTDRNGLWFFQAHSKKGTKVPPVVRIPRPWEAEAEHQRPAISSPDEMKSFFGRRRRKVGDRG